MRLWPFKKKSEDKGPEDRAPQDLEPEEQPVEDAAPEPAGIQAELPAAPPIVEPPEPEPEPIPEPAPPPAVAAVPAPGPVPEPAPAAAPARRGGWLSRLKEGLTKSTAKLTDGIGGIFTKRKLDDESLEEFEELLITSDLGPVTAARVTAELARTRFGKEVTADEVKRTLAAEIRKVLDPVAKPLVLDPAAKPHVILVVGVNGAGKTTTIGKMAKQYREEGKSVLIAAGDTFRAAAVQQLQAWGERAGCPVIARETGADAAGLAYDALERAKREKADVLLIDTAGRLQNKANLMAELQKIIRVVKKLDPEAPHSTLLVLDATTGQNAINQADVFREMVNVGGLIVTKLDGSARGGVLVALAEQFKLPVHIIGVGEGVDDMRPFDAESFARSLVGL
jgi:fused signal recognition particle receptor